LVTDAAGTAQTPVDRLTFTAGYRLGDFILDLLERYQSSFHQNANQTLVFNVADVRAYFQTDIGLSYDFGVSGQPLTGFLSISNPVQRPGRRLSNARLYRQPRLELSHRSGSRT